MHLVTSLLAYLKELVAVGEISMPPKYSQYLHLCSRFRPFFSPQGHHASDSSLLFLHLSLSTRPSPSAQTWTYYHFSDFTNDTNFFWPSILCQLAISSLCFHLQQNIWKQFSVHPASNIPWFLLLDPVQSAFHPPPPPWSWSCPAQKWPSCYKSQSQFSILFFVDL